MEDQPNVYADTFFIEKANDSGLRRFKGQEIQLFGRVSSGDDSDYLAGGIGKVVLYSPQNVPAHPLFGQECCVKLLHGNNTERKQAALLREYQDTIKAHAEAEDLVPLPYAFGTLRQPWSNPKPAFMMESLGGYVRLEDWLNTRGRLDPKTVARFGVSLVESMKPIWTRAHLTHGDLSPKNIMVRNDASKTALPVSFRVIDFGQAKDSVLDATGSRGGNAPFSPLEIDNGCENEGLGRYFKLRSECTADYWSIGSILFYLATAGLPPDPLTTPSFYFNDPRKKEGILLPTRFCQDESGRQLRDAIKLCTRFNPAERDIETIIQLLRRAAWTSAPEGTSAPVIVLPGSVAPSAVAPSADTPQMPGIQNATEPLVPAKWIPTVLKYGWGNTTASLRRTGVMVSYIGESYKWAKYDLDGKPAYEFDIAGDWSPKAAELRLLYQGDSGLTYILAHGYPYNSLYGNDDVDRFITQAAIWWYLSELGVNGLSEDFKVKSADPYKLRPIIEGLVQSALVARDGNSGQLRYSVGDSQLAACVFAKLPNGNTASPSTVALANPSAYGGELLKSSTVRSLKEELSRNKASRGVAIPAEWKSRSISVASSEYSLAHGSYGNPSPLAEEVKATGASSALIEVDKSEGMHSVSSGSGKHFPKNGHPSPDSLWVVRLTSFGDNKIAVIRATRNLTGFDLHDAKEVVEEFGILGRNLTDKEVKEYKATIEAAGGSVSVISQARFVGIRPNDLCPCGSGKMFKNCCGKGKAL